MISDPIADMLTQIRNVLMIKQRSVVIPFSKLKLALAQIIEKEGYIESIEKIDKKPTSLRIVLKYGEDKKPSITSLKRISKPGRRVYVKWNKLPWVLNNYGVAIVSTPQGLMTNREARKKKIGGEIICEIY